MCGGLLREAFFTAEGTKCLDCGIPAVTGAAVFENSTACDHEARSSSLIGRVQVRPVAMPFFGIGDGQIQNLVKSEGCRHVYGGPHQYGHDNSV
jgi:hypothetical protein